MEEKKFTELWFEDLETQFVKHEERQSLYNTYKESIKNKKEELYKIWSSQKLADIKPAQSEEKESIINNKPKYSSWAELKNIYTQSEEKESIINNKLKYSSWVELKKIYKIIKDDNLEKIKLIEVILEKVSDPIASFYNANPSKVKLYIKDTIVKSEKDIPTIINILKNINLSDFLICSECEFENSDDWIKCKMCKADNPIF